MSSTPDPTRARLEAAQAQQISAAQKTQNDKAAAALRASNARHVEWRQAEGGSSQAEPQRAAVNKVHTEASNLDL